MSTTEPSRPRREERSGAHPHGGDRPPAERPPVGAHPPRDAGLEALSARWRGAFDVADRALDAAAHELTPAELSSRRSELRAERDATAEALRKIAVLHQDSDVFISLMVPRSQMKTLLGVPADAGAFVFNLEGVLIGSAVAHEAAWSETFDAFIHARTERTHGRFMPFNPRVDYPLYMHDKPRLEGVRAFLASRGMRLPEGRPDDPPDAETVHGLANRKRRALLRYLDEHGVVAFAGARRYLELAHEVGIRSSVISASATTRAILHNAGLAGLVDGIVDGNDVVAEHLKTAPAPDALLLACERLAVDPARTTVFETSAEGIRAARHGGFGFAVGIGRGDQATPLRETGADIVVPDLLDLLQRRANGAHAHVAR